MEKKNVQRIVGVLVIVALVIIAMPLIFGKDDFSTQQAENANEPAFPEQAQTATLASNTESADVPANPDATDSVNSVGITPNSPQDPNAVDASTQVPAPASTTPSNTTAQPAAKAATPAATSEQAPAVAAPNSSDASSSEKLPAPLAAVEASAQPANSTNNAETATTPSAPAIAKTDTDNTHANQPANDTATKIANALKPVVQQPATDATQNDNAATVSDVVIDQNGAITADTAKVDTKKVEKTSLTKPVIKAKNKTKTTSPSVTAKNKVKNWKSPAWVVQLGCFKNKKNAIHLTDKLRSAGFKAFTREVKTASGKVSTKVFVGPEFKVASATKLSNSVQQKMNMQGIVVAYKPFAI